MNKEQLESYSKFIESPGIDGPKIIEDLHGTPFLQDYDVGIWIEMIKPVDLANGAIPYVNENIIKKIKEDALEQNPDRIHALFISLQVCLHPATSQIIAGHSGIINTDTLMIASTHIGVSEFADLYKISDEDEKKRIQLFALYLANAQAKILGYRTTTTLIAMDIADPNYLHFENIAVLAKVGTEEDLKRVHTQAIFEGRKVSPIKNIGNGKFFLG